MVCKEGVCSVGGMRPGWGQWGGKMKAATGRLLTGGGRRGAGWCPPPPEVWGDYCFWMRLRNSEGVSPVWDLKNLEKLGSEPQCSFSAIWATV